MMTINVTILLNRTSSFTGLEVHSPQLTTAEEERQAEAEDWQIGVYSPGGTRGNTWGTDAGVATFLGTQIYKKEL